jgi:hypothetical protein
VADRKILESPWTWVLGGALVSTWLLGVVHAYDAHSRVGAAVALFLPPYGLYMAVEQMARHPNANEVSDAPVAGAASANAQGGYLDQCLQRRVVSDQLSLGESQNEVFCTCSAQMLAEGVSEAEYKYVEEYGENSPEFMVLRREVSENCLASARSVGPLDAN